MKIKDSQIVKEGRGGPPFSKSQWMEVLLENIICYKDSHFYVRDGGLVDNYLEAQRGAATRLAEHWGKGLRERTEELFSLINKTQPPTHEGADQDGDFTSGNHVYAPPPSWKRGEIEMQSANGQLTILENREEWI